jgi:hypothetical protein
MIQMLAGAAPRLAGWLSASTTFLFGIVSFLFALGVLLGLLSIVGVPVLRQYNTIWSVVAILFLLSFQGFVAFQTASFVLPSLARSTGFGPEDPLSAMLVRISVADSLPGPSVERRRYSLSHALGALRPDFKNRTFVSPRLIHSLAYLYPPALDDISSWIGHVRKTAPPLSRSAASRARASK